jgi:hypothetical protein
MNLLRNGWTWASVFAVLSLCGWYGRPADITGPLAICTATQAATNAQVGGLDMQLFVAAKEIERLNGEVRKANQWSAGARRVIGQLGLQCRTFKP